MTARISILLVVSLLSVHLIAEPANAGKTVCLSREIISDRLENRHAETPQAAGLATNGQVLEVFTSKNGSWTLVLTDAKGFSCVIASGDAWTTITPTRSSREG